LKLCYVKVLIIALLLTVAPLIAYQLPSGSPRGKLIMTVYPSGNVIADLTLINITKFNKSLPLEDLNLSSSIKVGNEVTYTSFTLNATFSPSALIVIPFISSIRDLTLVSTSFKGKGNFLLNLDAPNFAILKVRSSFTKKEALGEVSGEVWYNPLLNITKAKVSKFFRNFNKKVKELKDKISRITNSTVKLVEVKLISYNIERRSFKFNLSFRAEGEISTLKFTFPSKYSNLPKEFYDEVKELAKSLKLETISSYSKLTFNAYEGTLNIRAISRTKNLAKYLNGLILIYAKYLHYLAPPSKVKESKRVRIFLETANIDVSNTGFLLRFSAINETHFSMKLIMKELKFRPKPEYIDGGFKLTKFFKAWGEVAKGPIKGVPLELIGGCRGSKKVIISLPEEGYGKPSFVSDTKVIWPYIDFKLLENVTFKVKS